MKSGTAIAYEMMLSFPRPPALVLEWSYGEGEGEGESRASSL